MLQTLHIENVAVIEKAEIGFAPGLNVLTGETGAGKSIVIDALGAVLGGRTSKELVRTGAAAASVTAVFEDAQVTDWCEENGVPDEGGELFLMRRIASDGKNTCRVNGAPVSVTQLRELGQRLLDIHGQNDGQKLLDERFHRAYLDRFAGLEREIAEYRAAYEAYRALIREIRDAQMDEGEKERRMDVLRYQIDELEKAEIRPGEQEEKAARRDLLRNAGKLIGAADAAFRALYGDDRGLGAASQIAEAESELRGAARYSEDLSSLAQKAESLRYSAEDLAEQLRDFKSRLDFSPAEYDALEGRLDQLRRLARKYGPTEEEMLENLSAFRAELDQIEFSDQRLQKLEQEMQRAEEAARRAAEALSGKRQAAAKELEARIREELAQLSMKGVAFRVRFERTELTADGQDEVSFLMSANPGEEPGRISRIASGGELARIMLAMKNVLAENDPVGVMVFDEIDTGVSGVAAQRVGEKLAKLAGPRQVLCVTHLPQIASMADAHFAITKSARGGRTYTAVAALDREGRKHELARLSGGENITEAALSAASELLAAAAEYKKKITDGRNER